jgi:hypothetical protein
MGKVHNRASARSSSDRSAAAPVLRLRCVQRKEETIERLPSLISAIFACALAKDQSAPLLFKGDDFNQTVVIVAPY